MAGEPEQGSTWICDTCKKVYKKRTPPYLRNRTSGTPPTVTQIGALLKDFDLLDTWYLNSIASLSVYLKEYIRWKRLHDGHKTRVLQRGQSLPSECRHYKVIPSGSLEFFANMNASERQTEVAVT